jgi:predicted PurR-regulated permease PerM
MKPTPSGDITRIVLLVLLIGLLLVGSFWTLLPFLGALIWATTIAVATWPALLFVQQKMGGRRAVAVAAMIVAILLVFILPLAIAVQSLVAAADRSPAVMQAFMVRGLGEPPQWIESLPFIGERATMRWREVAAGGPQGLVDFLRPYALGAATWAISMTGGIGRLIVQFLLILILTGIFYAQGETAARGALAVGSRLGGDRGERTIRLAGAAIRSVAMGVVVTALVQSLLAGVGLWVCTVPYAGLLTAIVFVFCIAQIGPAPIMIASIAWLYWSGNSGWGTALLIWTVPVVALDNVLRPILIRRGVQLPTLLIIAGVIGGLIGFGVLGLFIGPVILASTYTLAREWVAEHQPSETVTPVNL